MSYNVGKYLAKRLEQIGIKDHFAVAGDYNLVLLDQLLDNKNLKQIYDCNELNCGFAAEGYARANGAGVCVVTFSVGAISGMNSALGGAYAENLPVLMVSGGPNSNDYGSGHILHHTTGKTDYDYQMEMAKQVTCAAERITQASEAPQKIDHVLRTMLRERKPAYLEISCNISAQECPAPGPVSTLLAEPKTDKTSLDAAVKKSADFLKGAERVVILVGSKVRPADAEKQAVELADKLGCAVTVMAAAKSYFPEQHPGFRGVYWGVVSSPGAQELVDSADALITIGPNWNDYATVGWRAWPRGKRVLQVEPDRVLVENESFAGFPMREFLSELSKVVTPKPETTKNTTAPKLEIPAAAPSAPLTNDEMTRQIQELLTPDTTLMVETGDSWFNAMRMNLPNGCRVESEMQWGHIGWSIPSGFGCAVGAPNRRNLIMCGDGSFQLTAQEVGQMIRYELPVIIFLVDNKGYGIEIAIHDGPYNYIQNWNYAALMDAFNGEKGHGLGLVAKTAGEMAEAIKKGLANKKGPTLIQCCIPQDDCTEALTVWGREVAQTNARPPIVND
ncbi:alpha-keto acid decarboxylase family protein [Oecophyllibacter saccharovorans]|uniref:alpha-keto acid decarboxylase family protein n=1 Tax=Oecophyllibacter saccharovorans TaxID=2558360 RepID=UPI001169F590|nr:thiamine pyrophosphate-binding protein [Oecophyllibacter saccharovorans]TPW36455.1 alpha-keto acid decarboxylase family protein [Oecophyllibacter saccharovorans]